MVEMVENLDGRLGKRSVERVRYVINNLLHLVSVKYGDISLYETGRSEMSPYFTMTKCNKLFIMHLKSPVMQFPSVRLSLLFLRAEYKICTYYIYNIYIYYIPPPAHCTFFNDA